MFKIYLAVGNVSLENFLKGQRESIERIIKKPVKFVGEAVYREGVLKGVLENNPDVILIREGLNGRENISEILYKIKVNAPKTRIIFLAGNREVGDALLSTLVQMGVYDILIGSNINAKAMLTQIVKPNNFANVAHLSPKLTVDEKTNTKLFEAPDLSPINTIEESNSDQSTENIKKIEPIKRIDKEEEKEVQKIEEEELIIEEDLLIIDEDVVEEKPKDNKKEKRKPMSTIPLSRKNPKKEDIKKDEEEFELKIENKEPLKLNRDEEMQTPSKLRANEGLLGKLFGKKEIKRMSPQIVTFMGGGAGVGNSQIAFNTAIQMANEGYKVIYLDLNERRSAIDCIYQLGYGDVGIDTALEAIEKEDYLLVDRCIINISKILPNIEKSNYLYKTYSKLPTTLNFMFFSQNHMEKEENALDFNKLKDLNMYLLMQQAYDVIILDTPTDIFNKITEISLIYSNKIFFTVTQDYSVIGNHLNQIKLMDKKRIKFREKFYYLVNKCESADFSTNDVYKILLEAIKLDGFNIIPIMNLNKEFINANYIGIPILWHSRNKDLHKAFSDIQLLITK